jgi:PPE family/PE family
VKEVAVAQLDIDTVGVTQTAAAVAAASSGPSSGVTVMPPAADPVSAAMALTLQARCAAITEYSTYAEAITQARGAMLTSSARTYDEQEQINAASLQGAGGGTGAGPSTAPSVPNLLTPTIPTVSAPQLGTSPTNGKDISTLLHGGPGPGSLYSAAQQMRGHARDLQDAARQLQSGSTAVIADWQSDAGDRAAKRIQELSQWYERHGEAATAAAAALESHADSYSRARANTPTPTQFEDTENRLKQAAAANANPVNMGRYAPVVSALQTELGGLHTRATAQYADYTRSVANPSLVGPPLEPPPRPAAGGVRALDAPLSPPPKDDPQKYWLDLSKMVVQDPSKLGPYGYRELIPHSGVWYPENPSGPAKAPVDLKDIVQLTPGALGPAHYQELTGLRPSPTSRVLGWR